MTLLLVLLALIFLLIGYRIMGKIDTFIDFNITSCNENLSDKSPSEKVILIYGDGPLTDMVKAYCTCENFKYKMILDIHDIDTECEYSFLLVLSHSDVDNLMIGSVGIKVFSIPYVIALCNVKSNLKIFKDFNFNEILLYGSEINQLLIRIKETLQNAVKI